MASALATLERLESLLDAILRTAAFDLEYSISRHDSGAVPEISVLFTGPDLPLLLSNRGELLLALEHLGAKALGLEPEEHDRLSFDAQGFKAERDRNLALAAGRAIEQVRRTGRPFSFPPMNSRERRILHLALTEAGMLTQSEGEGARRHLVVFPQRAHDGR